MRCQDASNIVKLWRCRFYLAVPFTAIRMYISNSGHSAVNFIASWQIAVGLAQVRMQYYYEIEEVMEKLNEISTVFANSRNANSLQRSAQFDKKG
ncbi:MAG: hypothetical protein HQL68_12725 [Magnetococcales bacterium]|nr:hypothetical protein [Magnetococcales bacterium]